MHRYIVNRQVDKNYNCDDPIQEMHEFLRAEGCEEHQTACMLTAAKVEDYGFRSGYLEGIKVSAWVTAGLGNAARAGMARKAEALFPGTINTIVLIEGNLSDYTMANCVITATEAKTAAMQDLDVRVPEIMLPADYSLRDKPLATGTTTDAVIIAATGKGRKCEYAGTATWLGHLIGTTVYEAVLESGRKYMINV